MADNYGIFLVLVPLTYGLAGSLMYGDQGWKFYQPGIGGARFVAFNSVGWTIFGVSCVLTLINVCLTDEVLASLAFGTGLASFSLIVSSLFTYSNLKPHFLGAMAPEDIAKLTKVFNEEIQLSKLMMSGENASNLWYAFIGMQVILSICAFWVNAGFLRSHIAYLKIFANLLSMGMIATAVFITHAMGGKWKHINTSYKMFQPLKGGKAFCLLQALGWTCFSTAMLLGFDSLGFTGFFSDEVAPIVGILGIASEVIITASLFLYKDEASEGEALEFQGKGWATSVLLSLCASLFRDPEAKERDITYKSNTDHLEGEQKYQQLVKNVKATGDQYLVIGSGFVGKRLVKRLLQRGERKIRVFDISPQNPFSGDDQVEYICGDVTNPSSIGPACRGVDTVYATFAIIRFMDRLEHQAALSYRINVVGTERVIEACKENNVKRMIVTSSSHCTTDEHSQPRLGRDENAPYVVRKTAHNHYSWTKAIADKLALESNGATTQNGGTLKIAVVRPCSGVFGGDDRLSVEKALTMGYTPAFGPTSLVDWIYVENVVLGHILLEHALQEGKQVDGEAYCVSNNEPVTMYGFFSSVGKHLEKMDVGMSFDYVWLPFWPFLILGYISEWTQRVFKGRVSLGADIDMLSPGSLITATMVYAYKSDKAKRDLGYEPAWTVDEGIQQSIVEYVKNHNIGQANLARPCGKQKTTGGNSLKKES